MNNLNFQKTFLLKCTTTTTFIYTHYVVYSSGRSQCILFLAHKLLYVQPTKAIILADASTMLLQLLLKISYCAILGWHTSKYRTVRKGRKFFPLFI